MKAFRIDAGSGPNSLASDIAGPASIGSEYNKENISPESSVTVTPIQTPTRLLHMLQEQVRMLRRAAEMLVKQSHTKETSNDLVSDKDRDTFESDVAELQEQIVKLKGKLRLSSVIGTSSNCVLFTALLSTKREQIATLRTVVKANKQTAEVALANLKSKYETEKSIVSETMNKLRLELRTLKVTRTGNFLVWKIYLSQFYFILNRKRQLHFLVSEPSLLRAAKNTSRRMMSLVGS